jgi:NAD(P)H-hydrate epimerase
MREADRQTIDDLGLPSIVLMENAGRQVVAALEANYEDLLNQRIAVLCGRGSNGGDGFVVARTLAQRGVDVSVFVLGSVSAVTGDARLNLDILGRLGVDAVEVTDEQVWDLHSSEVGACGLVIDAIVGTGLKPPLAGLLETVVADLNTLDVPVVSIDLPSGLSADTPHVVGHAVQAAMTVTLASPKIPLVLPPAEDHAGDVVIADIGIPPGIIEGLPGLHLELVTPEQLRLFVQPRPVDSHKGDYGRLTIVAGSRQDRRRLPGRHGRPARRRRPGHRGNAGLVPGDAGRTGPRVHDRSAGRDGRGHLRRVRRARAADRGRRDRVRTRVGPVARSQSLRAGAGGTRRRATGARCRCSGGVR